VYEREEEEGEEEKEEEEWDERREDVEWPRLRGSSLPPFFPVPEDSSSTAGE